MGDGDGDRVGNIWNQVASVNSQGEQDQLHMYNMSSDNFVSVSIPGLE